MVVIKGRAEWLAGARPFVARLESGLDFVRWNRGRLEQRNHTVNT